MQLLPDGGLLFGIAGELVYPKGGQSIGYWMPANRPKDPFSEDKEELA